LKNTLLSKELDMPGLESRYLLKGYKGERRKSKYSVLWIFKSQEALEELFGIEDKPKRGPVNLANFEDKYTKQIPRQTCRKKYCLQIIGN
jgi:hypothetical protein